MVAGRCFSLNGLSVELLTQLSYRSQLGLSLKRTLRHFEREALIAELVSMTEWLDEQTVLSEMRWTTESKAMPPL